MRRSGTLLITLLLATAAAAGAGDNIKWKRSEALPFFLPSDELPIESDLDTILDRYTLKAGGGWFQDIREIEATFVPWEFTYYGLRAQRDKGELTNDEFEEVLEEVAAGVNQILCFQVIIRGEENMEARLQYKKYWEIYLVVGGDRIEPQIIRPIGMKHDTEVFRYLDAGGKTEETALKEKAYAVYFENPYRGAPSESLKLAILGKKFRRGFEWRFVEE